MRKKTVSGRPSNACTSTCRNASEIELAPYSVSSCEHQRPHQMQAHSGPVSALSSDSGVVMGHIQFHMATHTQSHTTPSWAPGSVPPRENLSPEAVLPDRGQPYILAGREATRSPLSGRDRRRSAAARVGHTAPTDRLTGRRSRRPAPDSAAARSISCRRRLVRRLTSWALCRRSAAAPARLSGGGAHRVSDGGVRECRI